MIYRGSEDIIKEYKKALIEEGKTQKEVAAELGLTRQAINSKYRKKHISFDDIAEMLTPIGYRIEFRFVKDE